MRQYFKKIENGYEEIDINSLPYDKYEWEREINAKKIADMIITSENPKTIKKILNNDPSIDVVEITCYNDTDLMEREEAKAFYLDCMRSSEGAEQSRYVNIYSGLMEGRKKIHD